MVLRTDYGQQSTEKYIQNERIKAKEELVYFFVHEIPESPHEKLLETNLAKNPLISEIPLMNMVYILLRLYYRVCRNVFAF